MKATVALKRLGELTVAQWGLVTTAQAAARGVTRMQLSRLTDDGQLERLGHGIYRDAGAPPDRYGALKAAWLSVNPQLTAEERLFRTPLDAVVSGATASHLLGLGDLVPEPFQFTVPTRRQTQRHEVAFRVKQLPAEDVTFRDGLPVTRPERTTADLVEERVDQTLVADVLKDIDTIDRVRLVSLLTPLARRNGFKRDDGEAFCAELERLAGRDADSLAKAISGTPLAAKIVAEHIQSICPDATRGIQDAFLQMMEPVINGMMKTLANALPLNQVDELQKTVNAQIAQGWSAVLEPLLGQYRETLGTIAQLAAAAQPAIDRRLGQQIVTMASSLTSDADQPQTLSAGRRTDGDENRS